MRPGRSHEVEFSWLLLVLLLAEGCGGRATDGAGAGRQGEASGGEGSGGESGGGGGNVVGTGGGGGATLPTDCPSWESGFQWCQTCGGQYVTWFGRFPRELEDYLLVSSYDGYCPPSEAIDFYALGEEPPLYHRDYHIIEWEPGVRECFYFVAEHESRARQCE